jgi:hypothetical protein
MAAEGEEEEGDCCRNDDVIRVEVAAMDALRPSEPGQVRLAAVTELLTRVLAAGQRSAVGAAHAAGPYGTSLGRHAAAAAAPSHGPGPGPGPGQRHPVHGRQQQGPQQPQQHDASTWHGPPQGRRHAGPARLAGQGHGYSQGPGQGQGRSSSWRAGPDPAPGARVVVPSTPARRLMAALNKLSARNYGKITHEVALIMGEEEDGGGVAAAVDAVLCKSAADSCYADVYARMALDAASELADARPAAAAAARRRLAEYAHACLDADGMRRSATALAQVPAGSAAEYDDLCAAVKAKKLLLGRLATALALVALAAARGDAAADEMPGAAAASEAVEGALALVVGAGGDERAVEVLLQVVKLLLRFCPSAQRAAIARVRALLTPKATASFGAKCRFLISDLLALEPNAGELRKKLHHHRGGGGRKRQDM